MRRFFIFMIPLCTLFFNCSQGNYGNFLVSFNDYNSGVIFEGVDADAHTETLYIPETVYGIPVVGIKKFDERNDKKIYAKTVVLPKSITSIGECSFSSRYYPSLKIIIIKGVIEDLDAKAFYEFDVSYTIALLSTTPPKVSEIERANYQSLKFYVPDESVDKYKKATGWSKFASSIYPLSEYPGTLP